MIRMYLWYSFLAKNRVRLYSCKYLLLFGAFCREIWVACEGKELAGLLADAFVDVQSRLLAVNFEGQAKHP